MGQTNRPIIYAKVSCLGFFLILYSDCFCFRQRYWYHPGPRSHVVRGGRDQYPSDTAGADSGGFGVRLPARKLEQSAREFRAATKRFVFP